MRLALILLVAAIALHHGGPVVLGHPGGHEAHACASCTEDGAGDAAGTLAAACLGILAMAAGVRPAGRLAARLLSGPVRLRAAGPHLPRIPLRGPPGPPPERVLVACALRC